jgi:hypothetical protein
VSTPLSMRPDLSTPAGTVPPPAAWTGRNGKQTASARMKAASRRHRAPYLALGVLLVVACSVASVVVSLRLTDRTAVLALARPVMVGQILSAQDLQQVTMSTDSGIDTVPASESAVVVGRPAAYNLPAGALLTPGLLGTPQVPPTGQAVAAVGLKPGQFPPDLAPGTRVAVLVTPGGSVTSGSTANPLSVTQAWTATVSSIDASPDQQTTVVSLQLADADARQLAIAPSGQVSLIALSGGGR